jgi:hypothetical protein
VDFNLIDKKYIDKWRKYINKNKLMLYQMNTENQLKRRMISPYKPLKSRGTTYVREDGSYIQGFTLREMSDLMGYKVPMILWKVLDTRKLPQPNIQALDENGKTVLVYKSDVARSISEYVVEIHGIPSKLAESYNDYIKRKNNG